MTNQLHSGRKVKSINFSDSALYEFATLRAEALYGGNFSSYILALIERDRFSPTPHRAASIFEENLHSIITTFAGQAVASDTGYDFAVPELNVLVQAKSRFPKDRALEYAMLGSLQKAASSNPDKDFILVYPDNLAPKEKERFGEVSALGISTLKVLGSSEFRTFLEVKASGAAEVESKGSLATDAV